MKPFHPELRARARWLGLVPLHARVLRAVDRLHALRGAPAPPHVPDVSIRDCAVTAHDGAQLRVRLYQPVAVSSLAPATLWIHGGGYVMGWPEQDEAANIDCVRKLGIAVAAVRYRRAPEHPFPTPLEDCYSALRWLHCHAGALGVDRTRLAVAGASAGGGLAAALAQLALDRAEVELKLQLLIYPMLDDRTAAPSGGDARQPILWSEHSNAYGWSAYLGHPAGEPEARPYAVPARRWKLRGLPTAWIGVGDCDLFHGECVDYAARLRAQGVGCELEVVPGAFHGFDVVGRETHVARTFRGTYLEALRYALFA